MEVIILIIVLIIAAGLFGIWIWGIVAAAKTTHTEIQVGRLLLHLFIWGSFIAAIVYAVKCSNNAQNASLQQNMWMWNQQMGQNQFPNNNNQFPNNNQYPNNNQFPNQNQGTNNQAQNPQDPKK